MLDTPQERIKKAGDRSSQVLQAVQEFGEITFADAARVIGISRNEFYRLGRKRGVVFQKGCRPKLPSSIDERKAA